MIRALLLACLVGATSVVAQTIEKVPYRFTTGTVMSNQLGDPGFWVLPNGGQLVTLDTYSGGAFPSFVFVDGGTPNQYFPGTFVAADGRGDVLALSSRIGGEIVVARPDDGGVLADGGVGLVVQRLPAPFPTQLALRKNTDGGFEVWTDTSMAELNHYALNLAGDGGFALTFLENITIPQATTGIAVDDRSGRLFVVQPTLGLLLVEPDSSASFIASIDAGGLGTFVTSIDLLTAADGRIFAFTTARNDGQVFITEVDGFAVRAFGRFRVVEPDGGLNSALSPHAIDVEQSAFAGFPNGALFVQDDAMPFDIKVVDLAALTPFFAIPLGTPDAGSSDGGTSTDGGTVDAGRPGGSSSGGPGFGGGSGTPRSLCGCGAGPFSLLPLLAVIWWRRRRSV